MSELPHLSLELKHRLGALEIDLTFALTQPWTVLFGPSGSGKSSILRTIAGLTQPDHARIVIRWTERPRVVVDTTAGIFLPAHRRPVRWTAQSPALFPHMTVRENLAFASEIKTADWEQASNHALQSFRLSHVANRKPSMLSGGEQQRVSIARAAVAANGRLLLLDEPFSGLDAPLRDELLEALRDWLAVSQTPVLSVTHDIEEAFLLGAEVIRIREGRVMQQGPVAKVLSNERTRLLKRLGWQEP